MSDLKPAVAWLGVGLMGAPMARRLLQAGYSLCLWNRTPEKVSALADEGADIAATPAAAVERANIVFTMLSDAGAIAEVLADADMNGKILVQMATIGPGESKQIAQKIQATGGAYLESPVLGSIPEAGSGKLIIMAGGDEALFAKVLPLLSCLGTEPRLVGEVGQAAAMKLALNQLIASLTVAFSTSLAFVEDNDVNVEGFMEILRESALYAPTFDKKLAKMLAHDYQNPNFPTEHLIKDVKLFKQEAGEVDTQMLDVLRQLYESAQAAHQREDYSCVYDAVAKRC